MKEIVKKTQITTRLVFTCFVTIKIAISVEFFCSYTCKVEVSQRKKYQYLELFWSAFFPHSEGTRRDTPYSVRMRENTGKVRTRITPNTDTFYAVFGAFILFLTSRCSFQWRPGWSWFQIGWLLLSVNCKVFRTRIKNL